MTSHARRRAPPRFHTGGEAGPADTVYLGVFRREALDRVGGYDEHFVRAQDWEMNHRIRADRRPGLVHAALRVTYRPRPNVRALAKQYFHYGRWRRVVARTHRAPSTCATSRRRWCSSRSSSARSAAFVWAPLWVLPAGYLAATTVGGLSLKGVPAVTGSGCRRSCRRCTCRGAGAS